MVKALIEDKRRLEINIQELASYVHKNVALVMKVLKKCDCLVQG